MGKYIYLFLVKYLCVHTQFHLTYAFDYFVAVNYGNLLLQALLEHWWRPLQVDEDTECQGDHQGTGQTRGGNEYFSVPGHTPVIFRCILSSTNIHLNDLFVMSNVMVYSLNIICILIRYP
jgi:hypothetical protein